MRPDLQKNLYSTYPEMFRQKDLPETESSMCRGVCCGDGWWGIIDALCETMTGHAREGEHRVLEARQVKSKFGSLRFYHDGDCEFCDGAVLLAMEFSCLVCEETGRPGRVVRKGGLLRTLAADQAEAQGFTESAPPEYALTELMAVDAVPVGWTALACCLSQTVAFVHSADFDPWHKVAPKSCPAVSIDLEDLGDHLTAHGKEPLNASARGAIAMAEALSRRIDRQTGDMPIPPRPRHLTKSRYVAGLQCLRRLWLLVHEPPEYEEPPPGSPLDVGQIIGAKAHLLFSGGVLVDEEPWRHAEAVTRTAALMADTSVPAIFEAAFEYEGVRVRVDVLERLAEGRWGLREVKSSGGVKDHHLDDVALQVYVLEGSGIPLASIQVMHLNKAYVRGQGEVCWADLFARADVETDVRSRLAELPARLPGMRACLSQADMPVAEPGAQCSSPYGCEFWDRCTADKPTDWIRYLPRLRADRQAELVAMGIESIAAIPTNFRLSGKQATIRDATASGKAFVAVGLAGDLSDFGPPALYLDFEAMMPPIPLYVGTSPFQVIPFQWSLHILDAAGSLNHRHYLARGDTDPRRSFAESLIEAVSGTDWPIIVYSAYEKTTLNALAALYPDLRPAIEGIIARLADLLPVVRNGIYHPNFDFSFSIKAVGPALCPDFGYDDLADGIADGMAAAATFGLVASGRVTEAEAVARIRDSLLAYCERDTLAMVEVHKALRGLAGSSP